MARIKVNTVSENMELLSNNFKNFYGEDLKIDQTSQWYMFNFPIAYLSSLTEQKIQDLADKMNIFKCEGADLDDILNGNFSFPRKQATKAKVKIYHKGKEDTKIRVGELLIESPQGIKYRNIEEGNIKDGSVVLEYECEEFGSHGNYDGRIDNIVKNVTGIYSVINAEVDENTQSILEEYRSEGGQDAESDNEYLKRWFNIRNDGYWNIDGIYNEVSNVDGVKSVFVDENDTMETNEKGIPPKSVVVVVDGGIPKEIGNAIWKKLDYAIQTIGDEVVEVEDAQGEKRIIKYFRPQMVDIEYRIECVKGDLANIEAYNIIDLVDEYFESLTIGSSMTSYACETEFIRPSYDSSEILDFEIYFKRSEDSVFTKVLKLNFNEKPNQIRVNTEEGIFKNV